MAFKLTRTEIEQKKKLESAAWSIYKELQEAAKVFDEAVAKLWLDYERVQDAYNATLLDMQRWAEDIASSRRDEYYAKSDTWQNSDRGELVDQWVQEYEGYCYSEVCQQMPDPIEIDCGDDIESFNELSEAPEIARVVTIKRK